MDEIGIRVNGTAGRSRKDKKRGIGTIIDLTTAITRILTSMAIGLGIASVFIDLADISAAYPQEP